jgi:MarR family transcriptional regulator, organic hydroperoxide resistance regulator
MATDPTSSRRRAERGRAGRQRPASVAGRAGRGIALELATLQALRLVFGSARGHDAEVRRIAGISGSLLWALAEIADAGGISVNELAERMALHQTTASNILLALTERRLVRRARDATDQRVVRLHITTEGKRTLLRAPGPYPGLLVDALRHLDQRQLRRLRKDLERLLAVMRRTSVSAAGETLLGE